MADKEIFMDTRIFTGIVEKIKDEAFNCELTNESLNSLEVWEGTDVGETIIELIKEMHKTSVLYRTEAAVTLPGALYTLRDGMIATDEALSDSLNVKIE